MKPDQERVKNLLTDTVTLLCRNGLSFRDELRVEGLIGITLDNNEVFLVHLNERVNTAEDSASMSAPVAAQEVEPEPAPKVQKTATRNIKTESPVPSPRRAEKRSHSVMSDNTPGSSADMPVLIENIKQEGVKVKQEVINSEQRVPPLHGPPEGAMNSPMNTSSGAMNTPSSSKRRASSNTSMDNSSGETGGGMFITGMVRNLATQMGQGDASWNSSGLSDLMQQMAEGQLPGLEGQSPVPNWPMTPGGGLMPPGTPQSLNQDAMVGTTPVHNHNSHMICLVSQGENFQLSRHLEWIRNP